LAKYKDLTGQKFGRLTVVERAESKNRRTRILCKCECGKEITLFTRQVTERKCKILWLFYR